MTSPRNSPAAAARAAASSQKRLMLELRDIHNKPNEDVALKLGPVVEDDLSKWTAVLRGPKGTAYEGGLWKLDIQIPSTYPLKPPTITFVTKICHPNVHFKTGEICLDLLKSQWSAVYTIAKTLAEIQRLLVYPEPDSPLNVDVAVLMRGGDTIGAESLVRYWTRTEKWRGER